MKKRKWIATGILITALLSVSAAAILSETSPSSTEDDTNRSQPRDADTLKESYPGVILELADGEVREDISVLRVKIRNQSDADIGYENEITIDRRINGEWKFWAAAGNTYEDAYGLNSQEEEILEFKLDSEDLRDADYIENADGAILWAEGHHDDFGGKRIAVRFPQGEYRLRKCFAVLDENGKSMEYEAVKEFTVM